MHCKPMLAEGAAAVVCPKAADVLNYTAGTGYAVRPDVAAVCRGPRDTRTAGSMHDAGSCSEEVCPNGLHLRRLQWVGDLHETSLTRG